jgi:hypothetical protein
MPSGSSAVLVAAALLCCFSVYVRPQQPPSPAPPNATCGDADGAGNRTAPVTAAACGAGRVYGSASWNASCSSPTCQVSSNVNDRNTCCIEGHRAFACPVPGSLEGFELASEISREVACTLGGHTWSGTKCIDSNRGEISTRLACTGSFNTWTDATSTCTAKTLNGCARACQHLPECLAFDYNGAATSPTGRCRLVRNSNTPPTATPPIPSLLTCFYRVPSLIICDGRVSISAMAPSASVMAG